MLIARIDRDGRYASVNQAYAARFGADAADLVGRHPKDVLPEALWTAIAPDFAAALAGARREFEVEVPTPEGRRALLHAIYEPERDAEGGVAGFVSVIDDVTERRRVERALRDSEATLRAFYDSAPACMGIVELTDDGDVLHVYDNVASCRFFGVPVGGTQGRRASALGASAETIATWRGHYRESAERGVPVRFEHPFDTAGERRWLFVTVTPVATAADARQRFCYVADDVTERRAVQEELAAREADLRALTDNIAQFAWTADPDGRVRWFNRRWFEYTGTTPEDMQGDGWRSVHHPDHLPRVLESIRTSLATGQPWDDTFPMRARDGSYRWFLARAIPIRDGEGRVVRWFGTHTDITAQQNAEQALRLADERKNEFLATLAHELRNPLNPIRNSVEVMRTKAIDDRDLAWCRDVIDRQTHHLARLVDDLFDVSRVSRGRLDLRKRPLELGVVVRNAIEASAPLLNEREHRIHVDLPDEPLPLVGDEVRLAQVFSNVLNNGAKYTEPGGNVWVAVRRVGSDAEVRVRDDGVGIPTDVLPHVFDMFVQAPSAIAAGTGGLGIGLTLARQLVELHGGTIVARSEGLGRGSEFRIRLPLAPAAGDVTTAAAGTVAPDGSERLRILIADDNADGAESLAMLLEMRGHDVRITHDGRHALRIAESFRPDLVFLDLGMPELDGYGVCRALRATDHGRAMRLIALTGWGQPEDRERTRSAGFDRHVVKPIDLETLDRLLDRADR